MDNAWFLDVYEKNQKIVYVSAIKGIYENGIQGITADDLVQEAFFQLYKSMDKVRSNPNKNVTGWLVLVVQNRINNMIKKKKVYTQSLDELVELGGAFESWLAKDCEQKTASQEEKLELYEKSIKLVGESDAEILMQHFIDRKTIREIAGQHGISEAAMQKRIHRMVHKIKANVNIVIIIVMYVWFMDGTK